MAQEPEYWEVTWRFEGKEFEMLRSMAEEKTYTPQQNVFKQGDPSDGMYLVLDGFALVIRLDPETGEERTVGIVSQGQSFGELGVLVDQPRLATVAAGTALRVLKITPALLSTLEQQAPHITAILYRQLARTLAEQMISRGLLRGDEAASRGGVR